VRLTLRRTRERVKALLCTSREGVSRENGSTISAMVKDMNNSRTAIRTKETTEKAKYKVKAFTGGRKVAKSMMENG
jgi:hypothetical protein